MQIFTYGYKSGRNLSQITGDRIKATLEYRGITQKDFFESRLGVKKTTYSKWISGENKIPLDKLVLIAQELKCSTDFLLGLRPVADNSTQGILSILTRLGYEIKHQPQEEHELLITKNGLSRLYDVNELKEKIDTILLYEMFITQNQGGKEHD